MKECVAILLALLLASCGRQRDEEVFPKEELASLQVRAIYAGISEYKAHYGSLPIVTVDQALQDNPQLFAVLSGESKQVDSQTLNPEGIDFLAFGWKNWKSGALCDPWGTPYRVLLDHDNDGMLLLTFEGNRSTYNTPPLETYQEFVVMSSGPNRLNQEGSYDDIVQPTTGVFEQER